MDRTAAPSRDLVSKNLIRDARVRGAEPLGFRPIHGSIKMVRLLPEHCRRIVRSNPLPGPCGRLSSPPPLHAQFVLNRHTMPPPVRVQCITSWPHPITDGGRNALIINKRPCPRTQRRRDQSPCSGYLCWFARPGLEKKSQRTTGIATERTRGCTLTRQPGLPNTVPPGTGSLNRRAPNSGVGSPHQPRL